MPDTGSGESSRWNRDTLVGVGAALVLVGAMAGVFLYERAQFHEYPVNWETSTATSLEESASLGQGDDRDHALAVGATGLSRVEATLTWTDDVGEPDTFSLTLEAPNGTTASDSDDGGEVQVSLAVASAPDLSTATGRSPEEARQQAEAAVDSTEGQGNWTATVRLEDAPGTDQTVGSQEDGANEYTVNVTAEAWHPRLVTR